MYRIGFIIEQALGHVTHGKNLQANVSLDPDLEAYWGLPSWEADGLARRVDNWTVKAGLQTRQALKEIESQTTLDALFFHTQITAVLAPDWLQKVPSVVSLDATPLQYDALGEFYDHQPGTGWAEKAKWWVNKRCYDTAKHLVTWSDWAKQGLIDEYQIAPEKVTVIPPGVIAADWTRPTPRTTHTDPVKILFVGGNLERKGGHVLLDACRNLWQAGLAVELHLATRDKVDDIPNVYVYNDMQPNSAALKQLYYECDIFCLPTFGDCLPMVLSEAGAASLPTVSTQVAAIPELVQDGRTGFLTPAGNVETLTIALRELVLNPELRLDFGNRAAEVVAQKFDAPTNAAQLFDLLKRVADQKELVPQPV